MSGQGSAEAHGETSLTWEIWEVVLPITGGSNEGGGDRSDSDLNPLEAEYGCAIYCDAANSGPVGKGKQTAGRTGTQAMVGTYGD